MFARRWFVPSVIFVGLAAARADEPAKPPARKVDALDIIPSDARAAVAIRNVDELTERGDEFLAKTDVKMFRLSDGYQIVLAFCGLGPGIDPEGSASLYMSPALKPDEVPVNLEGLVLVVPTTDFQKIAINFGLPPRSFEGGNIVDRKSETGRFSTFGRYL